MSHTLQPTPRIQERRELPAFVVEIHEPDCPCLLCDGERGDAPAPPAAPTPLLDAFCRAGWWSAAGLAIGTAIAFAIDRHGAWLALTTMLGPR